MTQTLGQWYIEEGEKKGEKKGKKEGQLSALQESLRLLVKKRFQTLPEALDQRIEATTDPERLQACLLQVLDIQSLDELEL